MAHLKLNEDDDKFIQAPEGATLVFAGASGTETWIERDRDATVRIIVKTVGLATADGAVLEAVIEVEGGRAHGQDGPSQADTRLRASQSVQVVVKAGQKLNFKAYPVATNAAVLRTVVCTADLVPAAPAPPADAHAQAKDQPAHA
jgi:hypothetical protein